MYFRPSDHIRCVLSRYDRIIIQGTLPPICYAEGMTSFLHKHKMRIFDYKQQFAQPLRDASIRHAKQIAHANGPIIEYVKKKNFRKENGKATNDCNVSGEKIVWQLSDDMGNRFNARIEGACIRHTMGPASVKLYDKFGFQNKDLRTSLVQKSTS